MIQILRQKLLIKGFLIIICFFAQEKPAFFLKKKSYGAVNFYNQRFTMSSLKRILLTAGVFLFSTVQIFASEADLAIPDLHKGAPYKHLGGITPWDLLFYGALVIAGTLGISLFLRHQVKKAKSHESMLKVAEIIFQTCKTYLIQQGKFLPGKGAGCFNRLLPLPGPYCQPVGRSIHKLVQRP